MLAPILALAASFALALALTPLAGRLAHRVGALDHPLTSRKQHRGSESPPGRDPPPSGHLLAKHQAAQENRGNELEIEPERDRPRTRDPKTEQEKQRATDASEHHRSNQKPQCARTDAPGAPEGALPDHDRQHAHRRSKIEKPG